MLTAIDEVQDRPDATVQAMLPQTQVTELAEDPSVVAQAVMGDVPHALSEWSQIRPVSAVQI